VPKSTQHWNFASKNGRAMLSSYFRSQAINQFTLLDARQAQKGKKL